MSPSVDESGREVKEALIRPNAFGYVLDLGAGRSDVMCGRFLSSPEAKGHKHKDCDKRRGTVGGRK